MLRLQRLSVRVYVESMRLLALALSAIITVGCGGGTPSGPSNSGISGQVIDFGSGVAVSGAAVVFGEQTAVTDATGRYRITNLANGQYEPRVDGVSLGQSRVTGSGYRGDLLVRPGTCVSRYGTLAAARNQRPVAGATVAIVGPGLDVRTVSGSDGWYRIDLGCPANGLVGSNTTDLRISHANYVDTFRPVGRGVAGVTRLDVDLESR
jgi:hypothetical protein